MNTGRLRQWWSLLANTRLRQTGRTTAMVKVSREQDCVLLCATEKHARDLAKEHKIRTGCLFSDPTKWYGESRPFLLDHYAVELLLQRAHETQERNEELVRELTRVRTILDALLSKEPKS